MSFLLEPETLPLKTAYFLPHNRVQKAQKMMQRVERIHTVHHLPFYPKKAALLLLDLQEYFLHPDSHAYLPSADALLNPLQEAARAILEIHQPLIFTQHVNTSQNARLMSVWWWDVISHEHPLAGIHSSFLPLAQVIIQKSQYDAFYQTTLESWLHRHSITQVVIGGVMTHLCCETTARSAFQRGFETFFLVDGTATYNEYYQQATLLNLTQGFATPLYCHEFIHACQCLLEGELK